MGLAPNRGMENIDNLPSWNEDIPGPQTGVKTTDAQFERTELLQLICKKFYVSPDSEHDLLEILD